MRKDPQEMNDLAADPAYADILKVFEQTLQSICDPDAVADHAKRDLGLIGPGGLDYTD